MKLNNNQIELLLPLFQDERFPRWKNIATNLLQKGECIVAGTECIWKGGVGNFIKTESAEGFVDCIKYILDVKSFVSSVWVKEYLIEHSKVLAEQKKQIEQELLENEEKTQDLFLLIQN